MFVCLRKPGRFKKKLGDAMSSSFSIRGCFSKKRLLLGHRLQAFHADFDPLGSSIDQGFNGPEIRKKNPFIDIVCMGNGVARLGMLSAHFACFRHSVLLMNVHRKNNVKIYIIPCPRRLIFYPPRHILHTYASIAQTALCNHP